MIQILLYSFFHSFLRWLVGWLVGWFDTKRYGARFWGTVYIRISLCIRDGGSWIGCIELWYWAAELVHSLVRSFLDGRNRKIGEPSGRYCVACATKMQYENGGVSSSFQRTFKRDAVKVAEFCSSLTQDEARLSFVLERRYGGGDEVQHAPMERALANK